MPRTDVKPLSYFELEAFRENLVSNPAPVAVEAVAPREIKPEPPAVKPLEHCPHCNGRLSALDLKFGQCLACRKPLEATPASQGKAAPVSIGI